jgi:hypothetical protein
MFRCPTTDDLGLLFYNVDRITWGFQFHVPKFDGYDELYVTCNALTCQNEAADLKGACDRSCTVDIDQLAMKIKRAIGVADVQANKSLPAEPEYEEYTMAVGKDVQSGPFVVRDNGFGPLISVTHGLLVVHRADVDDGLSGELRLRDTRFVETGAIFSGLRTTSDILQSSN